MSISLLGLCLCLAACASLRRAAEISPVRPAPILRPAAEPLLAPAPVASAPPPAAPALPEPAPAVALPAERPSEAPVAQGEAGVAAYYARRFDGRRTASGAIYDPAKLTAAHQSLPFGTKVKVVNLRNDREVVVTVNDRCRKRAFPFIDLSRAAARQLGFLGQGTAKVRLIVLGAEAS